MIGETHTEAMIKLARMGFDVVPRMMVHDEKGMATGAYGRSRQKCFNLRQHYQEIERYDMPAMRKQK